MKTIIEWVSIKERKPADGLENVEPETNLNVLINIRKDAKNEIIPCEFSIGFDCFISDDWRLDGGWGITHWMLFPKPPVI